MKAIVQHNLLKRPEGGSSCTTARFDHTITDPRLIGIAALRKELEQRELDSNVKILVKNGVATCEEGKRLLERKLNGNISNQKRTS